MLKHADDTVLTDWQPHFASLFGKHPLCLKHNLHLSPLFTDEALELLLERADRADYHVNWAQGGRRREGELGDLSGKDILDAVRKGNIWINLRAPHRADPAYSALLDAIYEDFEARVPGLKTYKRNLTILISSPKVQVRYHIDVPGQALWQVRGKKRVYLYPASEPFLTEVMREKVVLNELHETDVVYEDWFDDHALVKDLEPGEMLHWPLNFPHRVNNHDCLNVSVTTEHWTDALRNQYAVTFANGLMRKVGLSPSRPQGRLGLMTRLGLAGAVKVSGLQKREAKPYHIDFRVDPSAPEGASDIPAYDLHK